MHQTESEMKTAIPTYDDNFFYNNNNNNGRDRKKDEKLMIKYMERQLRERDRPKGNETKLKQKKSSLRKE